MSSRARNLLSAGTVNVIQSFYDNFLQSNAEVRASAGLKTKIIRKVNRPCCDWCNRLQGTYDIDNVPDNIYRRHQNCDCTVVAVTEKGYTDVWSKKVYQTEREARTASAREIEAKQKKKTTAHKAESAKKEKEIIKKTSDKKIFTTPDKEDIIIKKSQFGKKIGKHAKDFKLNPADKGDRLQIELKIKEIITDYDEHRIGKWRGSKNNKYKFFLKDEDVIVTSETGEFVTILKGGINNEFFKSTRVKNRRR